MGFSVNGVLMLAFLWVLKAFLEVNASILALSNAFPLVFPYRFVSSAIYR